MMRYVLCLFSLLTVISCAEESSSRAAYFNYLKTYPHLSSPVGNAREGEIEILFDEKLIDSIEKKTGRKVGIMAEDSYWIWFNDAVKFPSGTYGVYGRIVWRKSLTDIVGVAVMPLLPNGRIALNRNFRHATRSWEYELPRGGLNYGESIEEAALREVKEETGMVIDQLYVLGNMAIDSGLTSAVTPIFLAKVLFQEESSPEDSEAIAAIDTFSIQDIKEGFVKGYLCVKVDNTILKIPLRDPFLAFALLQAEIQELLP